MLTVVTPSPASVAAIYGILLQSRFDGKDFKHLGGEFPGFVARMPPTTMALFKWCRRSVCFRSFLNFKFASMASMRRDATVTPSRRPSERLHVA